MNKHLAVYRVDYLPYVISLPEYEAIARSTTLETSMLPVVSFCGTIWDVVIDSFVTPLDYNFRLLLSWSTVRHAVTRIDARQELSALG